MSKKVVLCHKDSPMCRNAAAIFTRIGYRVLEWSDPDTELLQSDPPDVLIVDASCGAMERFYPYASATTKVVTLEYGPEESGLMGFIDLTAHLLRGFNPKLPELIMLVNDLLHPQATGIRRKPRVPAGFECTISWDDQSVEGHVFNLSEDGAFVEMEAPLPKGTLLNLEIRLPNPLKIKAEIMWRVLPEESAQFRSPPGAGVSFIDLDDSVKEVLKKLVYNKGRVDG